MVLYYQKALHSEPDYATAHNNLGNALLQKGNVDVAIAHFQKALQINPDDAGAYNNLGKHKKHAVERAAEVAWVLPLFQIRIRPGWLPVRLRPPAGVTR